MLKAFTEAKAVAFARLGDTAASQVMLPFLEERLKAAREEMGDDYWSYGLAANEGTLNAFLRHHQAQGLSARLLAAAALFHPATRDTVKV